MMPFNVVSQQKGFCPARGPCGSPSRTPEGNVLCSLRDVCGWLGVHAEWNQAVPLSSPSGKYFLAEQTAPPPPPPSGMQMSPSQSPSHNAVLAAGARRTPGRAPIESFQPFANCVPDLKTQLLFSFFFPPPPPPPLS